MNDPIAQTRSDRRRERLNIAATLMAGMLANTDTGMDKPEDLADRAVARADTLIRMIDAPVELKPGRPAEPGGNSPKYVLSDGKLPDPATHLSIGEASALAALCSAEALPYYVPAGGDATINRLLRLESLGLATEVGGGRFFPTKAAMTLMRRA